MINVDISRTKSLVTEKELDLIAPRLEAAHDTLIGGTGAGSDFLGWVRLPDEIDRDELARVKKCAEKIGLSASADSSDYFHLSVPHKGN